MTALLLALLSPLPAPTTREPVVDVSTATDDQLLRLDGQCGLFRALIDSEAGEAGALVCYDVKGRHDRHAYSVYLHAEARADMLLVRGRLRVVARHNGIVGATDPHLHAAPKLHRAPPAPPPRSAQAGRQIVVEGS